MVYDICPTLPTASGSCPNTAISLNGFSVYVYWAVFVAATMTCVVPLWKNHPEILWLLRKIANWHGMIWLHLGTLVPLYCRLSENRLPSTPTYFYTYPIYFSFGAGLPVTVLLLGHWMASNRQQQIAEWQGRQAFEHKIFGQHIEDVTNLRPGDGTLPLLNFTNIYHDKALRRQHWLS